MAELKKYLDTTALGTLVDQIKAEDAKVLQASKDYADGLAKNYDAAGSASTAESNAKGYTDEKVGELANGAVKKNTEDIAAINADYLKNADKEALQGNIDVVDGKANKNAEDIAAINNTETGILAQAKKYADDEDAVVEGLVAEVVEDVAEFKEYVGTFTSEKSKSVIEYIDEKTTGIASDAALSALTDRVTEAEADIVAIESDYLKAADKTELEGKITAEADRAAEAEADLADRIKAVEDDYLVAADKTELEGKIDLKANQTALDAEIERATGVEESLQNQINTIMNNPDAEGAINSINEFTQYVADHGTIAEGMRTDINKNKEDIAAEVKRAGEAETALSERIDAHVEVDHDFASADAALKTEIMTEVNKKADSTALASAVEALEGADTAIKGRLDAIEEVLGEGEGSVADQIATAKQEAIDAAAEDATSKANKALEDAKKYADEEDAKIESRVATLEGESATHALASDLTALAGRVTTAEGEIDTLQTEMDAVEALAAENKAAHEANAAAIALKAAQTDLEAAVSRIAQNETDIDALEGAVATKAEQDDLDAAVERITAAEEAIAANASAIGSFTPITSAEVEALFA